MSPVAQLLGFALVFRTNRCYDRWWEGRVLWGRLIFGAIELAQKNKRCDAAWEMLCIPTQSPTILVRFPSSVYPTYVLLHPKHVVGGAHAVGPRR